MIVTRRAAIAAADIVSVIVIVVVAVAVAVAVVVAVAVAVVRYPFEGLVCLNNLQPA